MKILVTGGSGFVGKILIKKLLSNGYKVNCIDQNNIAIKHKNFKFIKSSISNLKKLNTASKGTNIIIHLAALLGVKITDNNFIDCLDVNIYGTRAVLEAAKKNRVKRVIFTSSSEIYGYQNRFPIYENFETQNKSVYAISKNSAEAYVKGYYQKYKINYNIIRFFNVYGPGQKKNFVISKFLNLASKNKTLKIYGNGNQVRSFCHVNDATDGVVEILKNGKKNCIYNIGNDAEPISMYNLAKLISSIHKKKIKIQKIPYTQSDRKKEREILKRIPSINKIKSDTNYYPETSLKQGIIDLVDNKNLLKDDSFVQKIGIGTLQFGLNYGVANKTGKLLTRDIKLIKKLALKNNIRTIDTANVYGDAEKRLGQINFSEFNLISKLPGLAPNTNRFKWVLDSLKSTLKKLKVNKIYGMHVHNTKFLLDKNGNSIYKGLTFAKKMGYIKKIGVSIYTLEELKKIISKYKIDLVLLPFNIFDQRLIKKNILKELKDKNIEIHSRTTFLQGLLLINLSKLPTKFYKYKSYFRNWKKLCKKLKMSKYEICLKYALSNKYIDKVIVGIDSAKQFKKLISSAGYINTNIKSVDASKEINLINPAKW